MFKSILVPIDLAAENSGRKRCLEFGANLAKLYGSTLHVMTVLPDFGMSIVGSYFNENFEKRAIEDVKIRLKAFSSQNLPDDINVETHVAHGSIYHEIVESANKLNCDAIVIAAHRPELKDYLLGPNAARVVRHADQSVFVIRQY